MALGNTYCQFNGTANASGFRFSDGDKVSKRAGELAVANPEYIKSNRKLDSTEISSKCCHEKDGCSVDKQRLNEEDTNKYSNTPIVANSSHEIG